MFRRFASRHVAVCRRTSETTSATSQSRSTRKLLQPKTLLRNSSSLLPFLSSGWPPRSSRKRHYDKPTLMPRSSWTGSVTSWLILCWPMYFFFVFINCKCQESRPQTCHTVRKLSRKRKICKEWILVSGMRGKIFGGDQVSFLIVIFRSGCFAIIWTATNYMYAYALRIIAASDVSALFSSSTAFVFFFSWTILHERFEGTKVGDRLGSSLKVFTLHGTPVCSQLFASIFFAGRDHCNELRWRLFMG